MKEMKKCSNKGCGEHPIEEFDLVRSGRGVSSQCKKCLTKKRKARLKPQPKARVVGKTDSDLANELAMMKW